MGKILIKKGDITDEIVDVIVNAANSRLAGGGGVDAFIFMGSRRPLHRQSRRSLPLNATLWLAISTEGLWV